MPFIERLHDRAPICFTGNTGKTDGSSTEFAVCVHDFAIGYIRSKGVRKWYYSPLGGIAQDATYPSPSDCFAAVRRALLTPSGWDAVTA